MTAQRSIGWSDCGDGSRTDGPVAFTHGEGQANVERYCWTTSATDLDSPDLGSSVLWGPFTE